MNLIADGVMIKEHECIVLTQDLPEEGLQAGDVGTVVHIHRGGAAFEVEFITMTGQTVAVATVLPAQLRPVNRRDILRKSQDALQDCRIFSLSHPMGEGRGEGAFRVCVVYPTVC